VQLAKELRCIDSPFSFNPAINGDGWFVILHTEWYKSSIQENYPNAPPRKYYRLTSKGIEAPDYQWSNPQLTLYPERGLEYFREKRKNHRYSRKVPTKSRRTRTV